MKRVGTLLMVVLVGIAVVVVGCGGNEDVVQNQKPMQEQQQSAQQNGDVKDEANPAGAEVQNAQAQIITLNGEFQGLADGHSAEFIVDEEAIMYQFYDTAIAEQLEIMETGTVLQFDVEIDSETGVQTIVKLYETIE